VEVELEVEVEVELEVVRAHGALLVVGRLEGETMASSTVPFASIHCTNWRHFLLTE